MGKLWAVSFISFFDNELVTVFVYASNWKSAVNNSNLLDGFELPDDMEEAKQEAFNSSMMFNVAEVPQEVEE